MERKGVEEIIDGELDDTGSQILTFKRIFGVYAAHFHYSNNYFMLQLAWEHRFAYNFLCKSNPLNLEL